MNHARVALKEAVSKTNAFFNDQWAEYRNEMEQLKLSPFKEVETIQMD